MCFIAAVLILITSYMGTATQASESNNTGINDNNKMDMPIDVSSGLSFFPDDLDKSCDTSFKCAISNSTGWKDKSSFQISTTNNTNNTWSSIYGKEIRIFPKEEIQLVSHMKLNEWATQSHIAFEGFDKSSKEWYQIAQCPSAD